MWGRSGQKCPVGAKFPPFGGASIASGYTPDALAGARPRHPQPQGGERSSMQRKKTAIITARMTPGIKDLIQHQAKQAGMTVTDYIITCALGKEIVRVDGLDEILAEVKAQGRNLNQLTTLANMGRIQILRSDELIDSYPPSFSLPYREWLAFFPEFLPQRASPGRKASPGFRV